jgi:mono/diheme cytochrome c family protein
MRDIVGLIVLIAIVALLSWLTFRICRVRNSMLKWSGVALAVVLTVAVSSVSAVTIAGMVKEHVRRAPIPDLKIEATPERIARGKAVVDGFCGGCHSKTSTLTGGFDVGEDLPLYVGSFISSNLTPAGSLKYWTDGEIFRAIRNGVDANGRWLVIMSYTNTSRLSDEDTKAVIAYIRSVPAAGTQTPDPPDRFSLLGAAMLGAGILPSGKPIVRSSVIAPPKGPTAEFGEYILSYQDCRECHGADLNGGVPGQLAPLGPDLYVVKYWKLEEFIATIRTGVDPSGQKLSKQMPWRTIGRMDDVELQAIYEYLNHLPR